MITGAGAVTVTGGCGCEILFVDAISEAVRYPIEDGSSNFGGGHLSQLDGGGVTVKGCVRRYDEVGCVPQWRI